MKPVKTNLWLVLISFFLVPAADAQDSVTCPCCTEMHRQFDFWIGDWQVEDTNGVSLGQNSIELLEDGCIISEKWSGAGGSSGRSYNFYNSRDSTWNQVWISSTGGVLELSGKGGEGIMTMKSELTTTPKGSFRNQITWSLNDDGSVTQHWELLDTEGNVIRTVFYGIYRRME